MTKRMISILKRFSVVVLVLILAIGSIDTVAFAATTRDARHTQYVEDEYVNPRYMLSGTGYEHEGIDIDGYYTNDTRYDAGANDVIMDTAILVRDKMIERKSPITVAFKTDRTDVSNMVKEIFQLAVSEELANTPVAGDYLAWTYGGYKYSGYVIEYNDATEYNLTFNITYYTTATEESKVTTAVRNALKAMNTENMTDYEKTKAIYDYVCKVCNYDYSTNNDYKKFTAYGAIIKGSAVCQGYSTLLYRMLEEVGMDSRIITSTSHSWNIVKIDNLYYNLDPTWDDSNHDKGKPYDYFLRCNLHFKDHVREAKYNTAAFNNTYVMAEDCYSVERTNTTRCSAICTQHNYELTKIVTATCTTDGYKIYHCRACNDQMTVKIPATGHNVVIDKAVAATYKATGKTQGSHCATCKKVIVAQKVVPKLTVAKANIAKATAKSKGFALTWGKQTAATGYQIQYSTNNKFTANTTKTVTITNNKTTSKTVAKLKGNTKYYIRIRAYKNYNGTKYYSSWSTVKNVKTKK